jgi:AbrB family looped-hinge helix DNA binding protein
MCVSMPVVKVSSKYQVVIPREIREPMGIKPGQEVAILRYNGTIRIIPILPMDELRGIAGGVDLHVERDPDREL